MKKVLSYILVLILILTGGGYLLAREADASAPGEPLYMVDIFAEAVQRTFTFGDVNKAEFEQDILEERALELQKLLDTAASEEILGVAVENLDKQRVRAEERVQLLQSDERKYDEATLARIQNRLEEQLQSQLQNMERVRERFEQKTFENEQAQENFQKAIENFEQAQTNFQEAVQKMNEARNQGNTERNVNDDAGDGINNKESNINPTPGNGR
ncbi:hypothetical protein CVU76_02325 [Candidatus Dojkabacteria bacterium HGW-Dojkabacteria-1]|uniref:DUF5667 domain-containing protein n=1 Tax=Candidatus Dojkabacteria bacterium HGW-Dojkabacteria-1 TaxID=2013761 RepID=A0A2N2F3S7_9BACT|nr:MAG: hypothetical protein CVU76_02325 [Candidatus Dojkabacteria bacterium HGW-Dojkabacteria-1]